MYYIRRSPEGDPVIPPYPLGLVLDVDDTLVSGRAVWGPHKGESLHDISRVDAARSIGKTLKNEFLRTLSPAVSQRAFTEAVEHSTQGSLAMLLHMAGITETPQIDPENDILQEFIALRQQLHLANIRRYAGLNPGAQELLAFGLNHTEYGNAVATTASTEEFEVVMDRFELGEFVHLGSAMTHDRCVLPKPSPEPFRAAAKTLLPEGLKKYEQHRIIRQMWGVDDSLLGIESAHSAKLVTVGMGSSRHSARELARIPGVDIAIDGLPDALALATSIGKALSQER